MTYCFRYRVRMGTPPQIETDKHITLDMPGFPVVKVSVQGAASGVGTWVVYKGCGFDTEAAARHAGMLFGEALLLAGSVGKLGVDIGFSRSTLQFSEQIHEAVWRVSGQELRGEMHGLMTFEEDTLCIFGLNAHASVRTSREALQNHLAPWIARQKPLTEGQRNCAALLNDSFFVTNIEGQFILRVSAIEALCDESDVGAEYQDVIRSLENHLAGLSIEDSTRTTVARLLGNASRGSLRQSYMAKFRKLLPEAEAKAFDQLYNRRSKFLHDGLGRGELAEASAETLQLATALLEAELRR